MIEKLIMNDWFNVAKYGLGTVIFVVPIFLIIRFLLTFVGIQV
jgi:thiol:disulfide interchange protein